MPTPTWTSLRSDVRFTRRPHGRSPGADPADLGPQRGDLGPQGRLAGRHVLRHLLEPAGEPAHDVVARGLLAETAGSPATTSSTRRR